MNRIDQKFNQLKRAKQKALIVFITAGDPSLKKTEELVLAFEKDGVDCVELGVPFSDPLADGPIIQQSSARSLAKGTTLAKILSCVKNIRKKSDIPILLMGYLNPFLSYGYDKFCADAHGVGVDGLIIPDLPPDDEKELSRAIRKNAMDSVYLLAPTSTAKRTQLITSRSHGFVYYVSLTGVTGSKTKLSNTIAQNVSAAKHIGKKAVCVGFGISTPADAKSASQQSDGVIVGSAVVKALAAYPGLSAAAFSRRFVKPFAAALGKAV